jgi:phosphatidate cytidylyltransferase
MLAQRLVVTIILLPIGLLAIYVGGLFYALLVALLLALAAREYALLFRANGQHPSVFLVVGGVLLLVAGRAFDGFVSAPLIITLLIVASMIYHLLAYERGCHQAGVDFSVTFAGALYAGWLGAYLISLRDLPEGRWWVLVVLPAVWLADSGAYFIGRAFGRHRMSPRLSPKKTWEGYLGGVVVGTVGAGLLAALWQFAVGPDSGISLASGAVLGFIMAALTPAGDLGESMIKRQAGMKDSGKLFPGHGGAFDRIDSWLWAAPIGYYVILWFFS